MAGKKSEKRKYSHSRQLLDKRLGLLLMVPIAAVIFGITGIPFIRALYLSFTNKVVGVPEQFIGFDNYLAYLGIRFTGSPFTIRLSIQWDVLRRNWRWDFCWQLS